MNPRITTSTVLHQSLASDQRRVLSRWRALIYLRRATQHYHADERRWQKVFSTEADVQSVINTMLTSRQIESIGAAPGCYALHDIFGNRYPLRERELLFELNPYAVLAFYSALEYHGFTQDQPKVITVWGEADRGVAPLGVEPDEWDGLDLPTAFRPKRVLTQRVEWYRGKFDPTFGVDLASDGPVPIRVTSPERTLVESLQHPDRSGGIANVLRAWVMAEDFISVNRIVDVTEAFGIALLRQRVGYVAEAVGLTHARFDDWAAVSVRGGSSRLVGSAPFASDYDRRWNLSLNGPVEILQP